jgi:hypothetical protein
MMFTIQELFGAMGFSVAVSAASFFAGWKCGRDSKNEPMFQYPIAPVVERKDDPMMGPDEADPWEEAMGGSRG